MLRPDGTWLLPGQISKHDASKDREAQKRRGLERYAPLFIDNDIDAEVLCYLTVADLERTGVSWGRLRKIIG